jgi:hypothetical protein
MTTSWSHAPIPNYIHHAQIGALEEGQSFFYNGDCYVFDHMEDADHAICRMTLSGPGKPWERFVDGSFERFNPYCYVMLTEVRRKGSAN